MASAAAVPSFIAVDSASAAAPASRDAALIDGCGRRIDHLRLSVTDACNLRCAYCRVRGGPPDRAARAALTDPQRIELVCELVDARGLRQVRLTGGEPLLHPTVERLVEGLRGMTASLELAMTTNGTRLAARAGGLRRAGLDRLNVSLDSLDSRRYARLTGGRLDDVLGGIDAAISAGFPPPRINAVVLRGVNDDEPAALAAWAMRRGCEMRFLEAMPIGPAAAFNDDRFVPATCIRARLSAAFELRGLPRNPGETATRYTARGDGVSGVVGVIAPVSERFCGECRRIRVTADGRMFPCLLDSRCVPLADAWGDGRPDRAELHRRIDAALSRKQAVGPGRPRTAMVELGG